MYYNITVSKIEYSHMNFGVEANSIEEAKDKAFDYAIEKDEWKYNSTDIEVDDPIEITEEEYNKYFKQ